MRDDFAIVFLRVCGIFFCKLNFSTTKCLFLVDRLAVFRLPRLNYNTDCSTPRADSREAANFNFAYDTKFLPPNPSTIYYCQLFINITPIFCGIVYDCILNSFNVRRRRTKYINKIFPERFYIFISNHKSHLIYFIITGFK